MYVTDSTQFSSDVIASLDAGTMNGALSDAIEEVNSRKTKSDRLVSKLEELEREKNRTKLSILTEKQLLKKANDTLEAVKKVVADLPKPDTSIFSTDKLEKFFEGIGLVFVALQIKGNGLEAELKFIRPSKMVSSLPVPPMLIKMYYCRNNSSALSFYNVTVSSNISVENGYYHPHISSVDICLGNYVDVLDAHDVSMGLSSYQDHVLLLDQLLSTYNPDSPYREIGEIIRGIHDGIAFRNGPTTELNNHNTYLFRNSKLGRGDTFKIADLITMKLYQDYFDNLNKIKVIDVLDDVLGYLTIQKGMYDDFIESREFLNELYDRYASFFGDQLGLVNPEDYAETGENADMDDYYDDLGLTSCSYKEVLSKWIKAIQKFIASPNAHEATLHFDNLPDLSSYYSVTPIPPLFVQAPAIFTEEAPSVPY